MASCSDDGMNVFDGTVVLFIAMPRWVQGSDIRVNALKTRWRLVDPGVLLRKHSAAPANL